MASEKRILNINTADGVVKGHLINARGDGNCAVRAVVQSLLLNGLKTEEKRAYAGSFLLSLFKAYQNHKDTLGHDLKWTDLRYFPNVLSPEDFWQTYLDLGPGSQMTDAQRKKQCPYKNSLVQLGDYNQRSLYYLTYDGDLIPLTVTHPGLYDASLASILNPSDEYTVQGLLTDRKVQLNNETLKSFLDDDGQALIDDKSASLMARVDLFLNNYIEGHIDPERLTKEFFSLHDDRVSEQDDVIYVLAGCLRFAIADYFERNPAESLDTTISALKTLNSEIDIMNAVEFLSSRNIGLDVYSPTGVQKHGDYLTLFDRPSNAEIGLEIDVYQEGRHYGTLEMEEVPRPVAVQAVSSDFLVKSWTSVDLKTSVILGLALLLLSGLKSNAITVVAAGIAAVSAFSLFKKSSEKEPESKPNEEPKPR